MKAFAIVGISCKLPQDAVDESSLWDVLEARRNLMTKWPESRGSVESLFDGRSGNINTLSATGAHFTTEDPGAFDAPFFSTTAKEAATIDPRQRWSLEAAYHAFENAGMPLEKLSGSQTAVFAASLDSEYSQMGSMDTDTLPRQSATGSSLTMMANRLSWFYNLHGPSVYMDTACSGSMVALDMACNSMASGDATAALVVGSSALLTPAGSLYMANMNFLSPDSKCYSFDERANGYARGEGIIAIVVKPVESALRDGDTIRAVIRGTGSNQDGHTAGITQPSSEAQEALIRAVYAKAGLDFSKTRFFEAHGTGTPLGDPIETKAVGRVFRPYRSRDEPLYVGSIKANIGHLEGASGLAGILKSILVLERGLIPPNALFEKLNRDIDAEFYNFTIPTECLVWPTPGLRRVSVNSFGFGGSNSHAVMDDAYHYLQSRGLKGFHHTSLSPAAASNNSGSGRVLLASLNSDEGYSDGSSQISELGSDSIASPSESGCESKLLVWSATDANALKRVIDSYSPYFHSKIRGSRRKLNQLAYTLAVRRSAMAFRTFAILDDSSASSKYGGSTILSEDDTSVPVPAIPAEPAIRAARQKPGIVFVFTGQGAQYAGMGLELVSRYPVFAESLRKSDDALARLGCRWSVFEKLSDKEAIHNPMISQPVCTVLQIALFDLLSSFSIMPAVVLGHSSGEIAAAYATGALSQESACKVAYLRGQLTQQVVDSIVFNNTPGAMMSVNIKAEDVPMWLDRLSATASAGQGHDIHIACYNSPTNITLSGSAEALDKLKVILDDEGIFAIKLNTGVAYHSPAMRTICDVYVSKLGSLEGRAINSQTRPTAMVSSVTGDIEPTSVLASAQYWADNLMSPVQFARAVLRVARDDTQEGKSRLSEGILGDYVEIGPHGALRRPLNDNLGSLPTQHVERRVHSVLDRSKAPTQTVLSLAGTLFCHGHGVSVLAVNKQTEMSQKSLVDCPPYPFDHSRSYWAEPRMSKDNRLRRGMPNYLLGRRSYDWNPLQPRWRNWLCLETMPWLADHMVSNATVCPGAGFIVMALEAMYDITKAKSSPAISGFLVKEAQFLSPITIGETMQDAPETELHLRPVRATYEKQASLYEIQIFMYREGVATECFRARVQVQQQNATTGNSVDGDREVRREQERIRNHVERARVSCHKAFDKGKFYDFSAKSGIKYGETFQLLENIGWDEQDISCGQIDLRTVRFGNQAVETPVHPTVLDASLHTLLIQISQGLSESISAMVISEVSGLWISNEVWHKESSRLYLGATLDRGIGKRPSTVEGSISIVGDNGAPLCSIDRVVFTRVASSEAEGHDAGAANGHGGDSRDMLYSIAWKPRMSSLSTQQLHDLCDQGDRTSHFELSEKDEIHFHTKIDAALRISARKALAVVTDAEIARGPSFLRKYVDCLRYLCNNDKDDHVSDVQLEEMFQECQDLMPSWSFVVAVGRSLLPILRGQTDPLDMMFSTDMARKFYTHLSNRNTDGRLKILMELQAHENPGMRILEIGAGTGGVTRNVLAALQEQEDRTGQMCFSEYVFTDISPSFFEAAKVEFHRFKDRMTFQKLDISVGYADQGFEPYSFDFVIAGSVLHATPDLLATLHNVRTAIKPGGYLFFQEVTEPESAVANISFGCLEGWWLSKEPWRRYSPLLTVSQWDDMLSSTGDFSGLHLALQDHEDKARSFSTLMVAKATEPTGGAANTGQNPISTDNHSRTVTLLVDPASAAQRAIADNLSPRWASANVQQRTLDEVANGSWVPRLDDLIISLLDVGSSFTATLSEFQFHALQQLLQVAAKLLWVTAAGDAEVAGSSNGLTNPQYAASTGLLRTLRSEETSAQIVSLIIESGCCAGDEAGFIDEVVKTCFPDDGSTLAKPASSELEFIVQDGRLCIGRLVREMELDKEHTAQIVPQLHSEPYQPADGSVEPLMLEVGTLGMLDTMRFVKDTRYDEPLAPGEVEIAAATWAMSFRDIFIAVGRLGNEELGFECAGVVTRVADSGLDGYGFVVGDRVLLAVPGSMRSHPRSPAHAVFHIPNGMSFADAVSALNPLATAYQCLVNVARLQRGEKILIHAAAGSTGQMAVALAQDIGAEIFATVGSAEKKQLIMEEYNIPEDHIFYSRDTSFAKGIKRVAGSVNVVLNSLAGEMLQASWECIGPYGRFVEIGKADIMANASLPMALFAKNVTFAAVDLHHISLSDPLSTRKLIQKSLDLVASGQIRTPRPLHVFPVSETEKAFRYMQTGKNTGRTIISLGREDVVTKYKSLRRKWQFDANASYVIAGGFGGIGRSILKWMANRGAKSLIVPSRSGAAAIQAQEIIEEVALLGTRVFSPVCDLSRTEDAVALVEACRGMPPVKGCINSAMHLQDAIFDSMTHEQWNTTIQSKIGTSWNLHAHFPSDMDFFILLSSCSGIYGRDGQANYAAGCTYQDALAQARAALTHSKSVSIDLGAVAGIGYVAEKKPYSEKEQDFMNQTRAVSEADIWAVLEHYCDPSMEARAEQTPSQIILGIEHMARLSKYQDVEPEALQRPLFAGFANNRQNAKAGEAAVNGDDDAQLFAAARSSSSGSVKECQDIVVNAIRKKLANVLDIAAEDVNPHKRLSDYGVDSLMAVELRNWIRRDFHASITVFEIMGDMDIIMVGSLIVERAQ